MPYDIYISTTDQWHRELVEQGLGIVIDPLVFRIGEYFLQGAPKDPAEKNVRWDAVRGDIGALASFFDLIVLYDRMPAFNYADTFDGQFDIGQGLAALLNTGGDKTLVNVDMEHDIYYHVKSAAIDQLRKRMAAGRLASKAVSAEINASLTAIQYQWEPSLWDLEPELPDEKQRRLARFLLGQLVFSGYAQQMGAPHVLAPKRASLLSTIGLGSKLNHTDESDIYAELRRRIQDAGPGWRDDELPWTPTFLPFLLERMNRYREGPSILLERAKELRGSPAIAHYRTLREKLTAEDALRSGEAKAELSAAADAVARSLDSSRPELEWFGHVIVEVLPRAIGVVSGALVGGLAAGPDGAMLGGLAGVVGEEALRPVQDKLWGWFLDKIPFRSARKLLARSVRAEIDLRQKFEPHLRTVWET
jgi:hypothetical protein